VRCLPSCDPLMPPEFASKRVSIGGCRPCPKRRCSSMERVTSFVGSRGGFSIFETQRHRDHRELGDFRSLFSSDQSKPPSEQFLHHAVFDLSCVGEVRFECFDHDHALRASVIPIPIAFQIDSYPLITSFRCRSKRHENRSRVSFRRSIDLSHVTQAHQVRFVI